MQMFGVGPMELMVILVLSVLVIGPDRMPALAADLARWIRQARAYATHLTKDFNEVVGELEKEAGASREDWKEIGNLVGLHTQAVTQEIKKVADQIETIGSEVESTQGAGAATIPSPPPANVVPFDSSGRTVEPPPIRPAGSPANGAGTNAAATNGATTSPSPPAIPDADGDTEYERVMGTGEDKPWYETDRPTRRTRRRTTE